MNGKKLIPPGLVYLADNITAKQNILGTAKKEGARWAQELNLPPKAETVFFAGCGYQYSSQLASLMSLIRMMDKSAVGAELPMRLAALPRKLGADLAGLYSKVSTKGGDADIQPLIAAVKVLGKLGVKFGYLAEDEPCCGAPLYYIGLHKDFAQNAEKAYHKLKSLGVKRVISIVPSCTYALRNLFPLFIDGYDLEVKHFSEVVLANISGRKLSFPRKVKVTYHDPCQLGRYLELIDEPRQILSAINNIELIEAEWTSGEWSTCCGGGGGFEAAFPELSQILATNRARELAETGAQIIVTHCPGCIMQLKSSLKELKADSIVVLDLAQVVAMAMEK
ncbi:MAG: (Fe-S)-binding protein [Dehalococcoidia bacterium]|nr:MAG: (Fe-S)-binding protein [Dehalococcoidia bacterium]